jgi:hypothetical protein
MAQQAMLMPTDALTLMLIRILIIHLAILVSNFFSGECGALTPTPSVLPCDNDDRPCATPTITPTPTVDPCGDHGELCVTPTATPTPSNNGRGSNGRSDGLSSCPSCTQAPHNNTQAVLGLSHTSGEANSLLQLIQIFGALYPSSTIFLDPAIFGLNKDEKLPSIMDTHAFNVIC